MGYKLNPFTGNLDAVGMTDTEKTQYVEIAGDTMTGDLKGVSFSIGANTLTTSEFANLDGQDQAVKTTDNIKSYGRDLLRYNYLLS